MIKGVLNYAYWHPGKRKVIFRIKEQLTVALPDGKPLIIPAEFDTDFASIPWWFRWAIPSVGKHSLPAVVHDYLYDNRIGTRKAADRAFLHLMLQYGVAVIPAYIMFAGVRLGGRSWWKN